MKIVAAAFYIFILIFTVSAQKQMTDREFDGFKGNVRSVSIETMPVSGPGNKRVVWEIWSYDQSGRKLEVNNTQSRTRSVFSNIDGFKTFKSIEGKNNYAGPSLSDSNDPNDKTKPIELPEKLVKPDKRFDRRFAYEYDAQGRVSTEREYLNNNKLVSLRRFTYDENGLVREESANDPIFITRISYKYAQNGNLIEKLEVKKGKEHIEWATDSTIRVVYSNYKLDAQGNWTERKTALYSDEIPEPYISMDYQVIAYYQ